MSDEEDEEERAVPEGVSARHVLTCVDGRGQSCKSPAGRSLIDYASVYIARFVRVVDTTGTFLYREPDEAQVYLQGWLVT